MTDPDERRQPALPDSDPLAALRQELIDLDGVPVADRIARFERVNDLIVRELAQLDEV